MDRRPAAKDVMDPAPSGQWLASGRPSRVADGRRPRERPPAPVRSTGRPAGEVIPATRRERAGWVLARRGPTSPHDAPTYSNRSLDADVPVALETRELMRADPVRSRPLVRARLRRVVDYCAKLGRRRDVDHDVDLFTVLPTSTRRSVATGTSGGVPYGS
jgi:hypothetical protein